MAANAAGDLEVTDFILDARLHPPASRRTRALAAPCEQLAAAQTTCQGTDLTLRYSVKDAPSIAYTSSPCPAAWTQDIPGSNQEEM